MREGVQDWRQLREIVSCPQDDLKALQYGLEALHVRDGLQALQSAAPPVVFTFQSNFLLNASKTIQLLYTAQTKMLWNCGQRIDFKYSLIQLIIPH